MLKTLVKWVVSRKLEHRKTNGKSVLKFTFVRLAALPVKVVSRRSSWWLLTCKGRDPHGSEAALHSGEVS